MHLRTAAYASALLFVTFVGIRGEDADVVGEELVKAKTALDDAVQKANSTLAEAFAAKVKEVAVTGNLDSVKKLIADKESFEAEGKLPTSRDMKAAASQHQQSIKKAREAMDAAYDKAVRQYTKDLKLDKADSTKTEWEVFKTRARVRTPTISSAAPIVIHAAFYGQNVNWVDVTDKLREMVRDKYEWATVVNTADWGDPAPGYTGPRTLIIRYTIDGVTKSKWAYQGDKLAVP
jgi:hypothetical protein